MNKYYLAYGSNLNLNQMYIRCEGAKVVGTTILKDYRLVYKGSLPGYSYLTIEPCKGSYVPLGIYKINSIDEKGLDIYEGYPELYYKDYIDVTINEKKQKALIYVMNDEFEYNLPAHFYVETCKKGYKDFGFDKKILEDAYMYTLENLKNEEIKCK